MPEQPQAMRAGNVTSLYACFVEVLIDEFIAELQKLMQDDGGVGCRTQGADSDVAVKFSRSASRVVDMSTGSGKTYCALRVINGLQRTVDTIQGARKALDLIAGLCKVFGLTPSLRRAVKYWCQVLAAGLTLLAKLFVLFAYSRYAILKLPLFADGPELSGYKHRLR